ncbi:MAG: CHAT domain-containing protein [Bacteroidetes bacterium]|nr:CHAT domain-containing protein [Bacteroidota bacterium]
MHGKVQLLLLAFLVLVSFHDGNPSLSLSQVNKLFNRSDSLLNLPNPTDNTDREALNGFEQLIIQLEKNSLPGSDSILFLSYVKKGVLMDIKTDYGSATHCYRKALDIGYRNNDIADSLIFMTYVNAGSSYYNLNNFDSSNYFLLRAESLINHFAPNDDKVRLYNTLGVLYHDKGDYLQSKNYFTQALEILKNQKPIKTMSVVSIETNIATSFFKLGLYEQALAMYKDALKYKLFGNQINLNMGRTYTALKKYDEALACFRNVNISEVPWVYNEIAYTQIQLRHIDSATYFLDHLNKNTNQVTSVDIGINEYYKADMSIDRGDFSDALDHLQSAIIIFSGNFKERNINVNPSNFTGTFAYYRLFDALDKKAGAFFSLYNKFNKEEYLLSSFNTYQSALSLLEYIEKSYDTDDAKILLKKKSRNTYQRALSVSLALYRLHPKSNYLEQAFLIGEKNKASIVSGNLKEKSFNINPGTEDELLQKERNVKYNIARLDVQSDQVKDNKLIESLANEKAGYEIELSRLQKILEQNNAYYKLKYDNTFPGIEELQKSLTDKQSVISFYTTEEALHVFAVTRNSFVYTTIDSVQVLQRNVDEWLKSLKTAETGRKFSGEKTGMLLYNQLIKPLQVMTPGKDEWTIIPDDILYFLPFESLPSGSGTKTLLETTTINYQFSSRFIVDHGLAKKNQHDAYRVLSFAPFTTSGIKSDEKDLSMDVLPASADEIADTKGERYTDREATKENFLKSINKFPVVHLATHAVSDINNSAASFIAFYPQKKSRQEDFLFLEELYGLNMDKTKLVIISACETGEGELVNNEGVISLARAFIYAGCSSTVNSLWKADDKSTASILKQFHIYLEKGYSKSKALQQAKLDYIHSNTVYKSPAYWSHLILIGDNDPVCQKKSFGNIALLATLSFCSVFLLIIKRKQKKKKKSTLSTDAGS